MTISICFTKIYQFYNIFFFSNLFLLNYFTFKISSNVILVHVKTEVVAKTMTDLSLVRVMLDGQERCVKSVGLCLKRIGFRC